MDTPETTFHERTVLLFFVRWPEAGRVKTRLAADLGADEACRVHRILAERCFAQACGVPGADVVVCGTGAGPESFSAWLRGASAYWEQPGGDLGDKLAAMFSRAFEAGARRVAAIGSDAPELEPGAIASCIDALDHHGASVLPARDGGYVMIAMIQFAPELFADMPWSTPDLLDRTLDAAGRAGVAVHMGPLHADVDTIDDWNRVQRLVLRPLEHKQGSH